MQQNGALSAEDIAMLDSMCPAAQKAQLGSFLSILGVLSESISVADFTDGGSTSGYKDLVAKLPKGAVPLAWKFVGTGAFSGDTSATMEVGIEGDTDRFSADTAGSVFAAATVGSLALAADALKGISAAVTVRVTVTTSSDFTTCKTAGKGAGTIRIYYLKTE